MSVEKTLLELDERLGPGRIEVDVPLAPLTTFRIGGRADRLFHARTPNDLADSILAARDLRIPYFLLGKGANVLVGDRGFRGLVIHCEVGGTDFLDDGRVRAAHMLIWAALAERLAWVRLAALGKPVLPPVNW